MTDRDLIDDIFFASAVFVKATGAAQISMLLAFITVAKHEGITILDLSKKTGCGQSGTSRQLADLANRNRSGGEGLGLIEQRMHGLFTTNWLTPKGRALIAQMARVDRKMAA